MSSDNTDFDSNHRQSMQSRRKVLKVLTDMDTADASSVTRISVGRRWFSWSTAMLLSICVVTGMFFSTAAIVSLRWRWWLGASLAVFSAWALIGRELHRARDRGEIAYIEMVGGAVTYVPSRKMRREQGLGTARGPFPVGSSLECHIATGDRYFTGDHRQRLLTSLWIVQPDGRRDSLLSDVLDLSLRTALTNLRCAGVPFRVIKVYDGQEGEHTETDITAKYAYAPRRSRTALSILLGTSNLWLGAMAAVVTRNVAYVAALGLLGFATMAVIGLRSRVSKRSAIVEVATLIPSYAAGYAFAVIAVWYIFKG